MATETYTGTVTDSTGQTSKLTLTLESQAPDGGNGGGGGGGGTEIKVGDTTVYAATDSGNGNMLLAQDINLTQDGTLQSLSFYVATMSGNLRLGIYDASGPNGGPGTLLTQTNSFTPNQVGWNTQNVLDQRQLRAGKYWIAYHPSSNGLQFKKQNAGDGARYYAKTYGALPAQFSATPSKSQSHWSFYATFLVSSSVEPIPPEPEPPTPDTGFTVFTESSPAGEGTAFTGAGTRKIYVSSSVGNDSNPGTQAAPKRSIGAGKAALRTGYADWLLFKKGDTWTEQFGEIQLHGKSATEPMMFGAYGSGARPVFKTNPTDNAMMFMRGDPNFGSNLAIVGLEFYCYQRDPNNAAYNINAAQNSSVAAIASFNPLTWFLVEDCKLSFYVDNLNFQGINHLIVKRCVIVDAWALEANQKHAQGVYVSGYSKCELIENYFDHNGWLGDNMYQPPTKFNHQWYLQNDAKGPLNLIGNFSFRDNAGGQGRNGGNIEMNVAVGGGELTNATNERPLTYKNNLITEQEQKGGDVGLGDAFRIIMHAAQAASVTTGNIVCHQGAAKSTGTIAFEKAPANCTVTDNIFYNWTGSWIGDPGSGSTLTPNDIDLAGSNSKGYSDPNRTIAKYAGSIGLAATQQAFIDACRNQSKDNWNSKLMAKAVINYFRAGFDLPAL